MATPVDELLARLGAEAEGRVKKTVPYPAATMLRLEKVRTHLSRKLAPIGQTDLMVICIEEGLGHLEKRLGLVKELPASPARLAADAEPPDADHPDRTSA